MHNVITSAMCKHFGRVEENPMVVVDGSHALHTHRQCENLKKVQQGCASYCGVAHINEAVKTAIHKE